MVDRWTARTAPPSLSHARTAWSFSSPNALSAGDIPPDESATAVFDEEDMPPTG